MCMFILKSIFMFINTVIIILGLAVISLGIAVIVLANQNAVEGASTSAIILIVIGIIITSIFCFGCCGAISKNRCLLITYTVILIVLAVLTILAQTAMLKGNDVSVDTVSEILVSIEDAEDGETVLAALETALQCCGTTGPDYYNSSIPITCCPSTISNLTSISSVISTGNINSINTSISTGSSSSNTSIASCSADEAYQDGCASILVDYVQDVIKIVNNTLIGIYIAEFVMAIIAILLICFDDRTEKPKGGIIQMTQTTIRV